MVKHLTYNPKIEGFNPTTGTRREKMAQKILFSKLQCTRHGSLATAAYVTAIVTYGRKMLIKLTPGANVIKLFTAVSYEFF